MCVSGKTVSNPPPFRIFFIFGSAAKVHRSMLDPFCVLPSRKPTPTAALNLTGDIELALSMFMATIDTLFSPVLHRKGNATVTFTGLGNVTVTFDRVTYSKQVVGPAVHHSPNNCVECVCWDSNE